MNVSYTYIPVCPTVAGIGRIGVHHQPTQLVVTFDGPVDPAKAADPADYYVIRPSGKTIRIKSATFDPATNSATVVPATRLNVHYDFKLSVMLPCPNEQTGETVVVPFGGKGSLIGFHNHRGEFVTVKNGRITGFDNRPWSVYSGPRRQDREASSGDDRAIAAKDRSSEWSRAKAAPVLPTRPGSSMFILEGLV